MKIIHAADLHLGTRAFTNELRKAFVGLCEYANEKNISNILLSGDVFDVDMPGQNELANFYDCVKKYDKIAFYYLKGNHDNGTATNIVLPNIHYFDNSYKVYDAGDNVKICGIEFDGGNFSDIYEVPTFNAPDFNIIMLHGMVTSTIAPENIVVKKFAGKNIDYIALGHIHTYVDYEIDTRGRAIYTGCIYPRGFDELGPKGFVVIDTDTKQYEFVQLTKDEIKAFTVDCTGSNSAFDVIDKVKNAGTAQAANMICVSLTGGINFSEKNLAGIVENGLDKTFKKAKIKDETYKVVDFNEIATEMSLKGEFVRSVIADGTISDADKNKIIETGLAALEGRL